MTTKKALVWQTLWTVEAIEGESKVTIEAQSRERMWRGTKKTDRRFLLDGRVDVHYYGDQVEAQAKATSWAKSREQSRLSTLAARAHETAFWARTGLSPKPADGLEVDLNTGDPDCANITLQRTLHYADAVKLTAWVKENL